MIHTATDHLEVRDEGRLELSAWEHADRSRYLIISCPSCGAGTNEIRVNCPSARPYTVKWQEEGRCAICGKILKATLALYEIHLVQPIGEGVMDEVERSVCHSRWQWAVDMFLRKHFKPGIVPGKAFARGRNYFFVDATGMIGEEVVVAIHCPSCQSRTEKEFVQCLPGTAELRNMECLLCKKVLDADVNFYIT